MELNADFTQRVVVRNADNAWRASPMPGVERKMLDRIGDEVARATTIVRYAPGSAFSAHRHDGGEEYLVLDGVFSDEHGDFPKGSYVRNPPTSQHTPRADDGAIIFVKLHQFDPADRTHVHIDTNKTVPMEVQDQPGIAVTPLFQDHREEVRLEHWEPGTERAFDTPGGLEVLVLDGEISESGDTLRSHDWLRLPVGSTFRAKAGAGGAKIWIKTGHLLHQT